MKRNIIFSLLFFYAVNLSAQNTLSLPKKAALRSFILPGWGQFYTKRSFEGVIFSGLTVISVASTVIVYYKAQHYYKLHESNFEERDFVRAHNLYNKYQNYISTTNILLTTSVFIWMYNVIDAYLFAPKGDVKLSINKQGATVSFKF